MPLVRVDTKCSTTCKDVVIPDKNGNPIGGISCKKTCQTFTVGKRHSDGARPSDVITELVGFTRGTREVMRTMVTADGGRTSVLVSVDDPSVQAFGVCKGC